MSLSKKLAWVPLTLVLALAACESQTSQTLTFPATGTPTVSATLLSSAAGSAVTIARPAGLPTEVRQATKIQVAVAGTLIDVAKAPDGPLSFTVPANTRLDKDAAGNARVIFVLDDTRSVPVVLATAGPATFEQPPVTVSPNNGAVTLGERVTLTANTSADAGRFQFGWSYAATAQGPFQAIPGDGKTVEWTPPAAGNFVIKVDAIDRETRESSSATTSQAVVLVGSADAVIDTDPATGFTALGGAVTLSFKRPAGLGGDLHYAWSAGTTPQGPFTAIAGDASAVRFVPGAVGSYYVKVDVSDSATGRVSSFVSPTAAVVVGSTGSVVSASDATLERGDAVSLSLNAAAAGDGPFTWYVAPVGGSGLTGPSYTRLVGQSAKSISYIATDAGSFNFRVDAPQPDGTVATFTTSQPILNVAETRPLIQSDPPNTIVGPGNSVTLKLNAAGLDEGAWQFIWSVSTNPAGGFVTLPLDNADQLKKKTRTWRTSAGAGGLGATPTGAYYVKVDATEVNGTRAVTFVSSTPVVTVQP